MRRILYLVAGSAILAVLGWNVWRSEALIASGREVLLALAPVDPRSLMQGDYMRLRWDVERERLDLSAGGAVAVFALDARRVGTFRRLAAGGTVAADEIAFRVGRRSDGGLAVEPHSFLFQEGTAELWAQAKFGIFRVDGDGRHLLVGLADANARRIEPPASR